MTKFAVPQELNQIFDKNDATSPINRRAISRDVVRLALPVIGQSLLETLVFLVDRLMLGRHSTESLASMQISGPLVWSISSVLGAFSIGSVALVGRAIGSGDRILAAATARTSILLAVGIGVTASALSLVGLDSLLALLGAGDTTVQATAARYLSIVLLAMPLLLLSMVSAAMLQAAGNTRTPFLVAMLANAVNAILDYALIFGHWGAPELGVRGAAIGSAVALALNAGILLMILARRESALTFRGWGGESAALKRLLRISFPAFGDRGVQHLGYIGFITMIGALGSTAMAANQALISIESICFLSADGFGVAAAAIVAQRLGAKHPKESAFGAWIATALAIALLSLCGLAFMLIPKLLLSAFSPDKRIILAGVPCLYVAAVAQPFMAISTVLAQGLRGAGDTKTAFYVSLAGWLVVRLSATYLFAFTLGFGLVGVWLGSTCDWIFRSIILVIVFVRGRWQLTTV
ncbi:MAG: MATE family efflux transporter [Symplocastrum torsivum CPER-KK1]|uniref:Probable multidrug resistance protein NorM n=1 Tax=Symplocastrum torsivum CPER-KK1 TaxID=450513 RepID=A0A951PQG5_9CYAN|nr:MATE family efflux transporter [Symplocastrum torsivum CPER-KK1]